MNNLLLSSERILFKNDNLTNVIKKYLKSINSFFNEAIQKKIAYNIDFIIPEMDNEYNRLLNKYMKERLIDSYNHDIR